MLRELELHQVVRLYEAVPAFTRAARLPGLCAQLKQAMPGQVQWLFVEGSDAEGDPGAPPFMGPAGKLLDGMLHAIGLARGEAVEAADREIERIAPKLIVALGETAAKRLLGAEASLESLRGHVHRYKGIALIVTYHPAELLRTLPQKARAWEDLVFARRVLRGAA
jgi:uracil-DNA glycosylase